METIDEEVTAGALDFIDRAHESGKPFFLWWNSTRMHVWTHLKEESEGKTGLGIYPDGMVEHDAMVGEILDKLEELGIADNTIVMYSTDDGAEVMTWPDGGTTPFAGEKNTQWEGGYRVPTLIRWPGVIEPGTRINNIASHEDMLPTLVAAAGSGDIKERLLEGGVRSLDRKYKVHLDGYNLLPALKGEEEWPRKEFLYWTDDGNLAALRYDQWKVHFLEQRGHGFDVSAGAVRRAQAAEARQCAVRPVRAWASRRDGLPEMADGTCLRTRPGAGVRLELAVVLKEFPPRQKPGSFSLSQVMDKLTESPSN